MMSPQMTRLDEHLQRLRLSAVRERLEALLQEAAAQELSYADLLDRLLSEEVEAKTAKHVTTRTSLTRFPFIKGLDSFEFGYQPSVDRKQVQKLSLCHFVIVAPRHTRTPPHDIRSQPLLIALPLTSRSLER